jgi:thioredoxin
MKKLIYLLLLLPALAFQSCIQNSGVSGSSLSATEFAAKTKDLPNALIIDVRTPDEFSEGHIEKATNIDWNGQQFDEQLAGLDKNEPVFVYCLSGGRSGAAASKMRSDGFKQVYELEGGMMKWRAAHLPEAAGTVKKSMGMSQAEFDAMLASDKLTLVDFYADWCAPCQKMKPFLEEIAAERTADVKVLRINADDNEALCQALEIESLPVVMIYNKQKQTFSHIGYISKEDLIKELHP